MTQPDGIKRDRFGRYLINQPNGCSKPYTRATTFAKTIADTFALGQWNERNAVKGVAMRQDLLALAAATSLEDKDTLNRIAAQAKEAAGASSKASVGTALHSFTESIDRGEDPVVPEQWAKDIAAYKSLVKSAGFWFPPNYIECVVVVERYGVAGTFDRIAQLRKDIVVESGAGEYVVRAGTWVVVDLKTGQNLKYSMSEISTQLHLYASADYTYTNGVRGEMPKVDQNYAFVIHLPSGRGEASLHAVSLAQGARNAKLCAEVRAARSCRNISVPIELDTEESLPSWLEEPSAPKMGFEYWANRIGAAQSRSDLTEVWRESVAAGEWSTDLRKLGDARAKKFPR